MKRTTSGDFRIGGRRKRNPERQRVARHEPRLGRHQAREAPREQSRSHEEDQGHRRLRDNQEVATAVAARMIGGASSAVAQTGQHVGSRVPDRRTKTEEQGGDHCGGRRHEEHPAIDADLIEPRHGIRREPEQTRQADRGHQHADNAADRREHEGFRNQCSNQCAAVAAERNPDRDFPLARFGADQAQVGHVAAGDEQHHCDGPQQNPERLADRADYILLHRVHDRTVAAVGQEGAIVWTLDVFTHRSLDEWREIRRSLVGRDARPDRGDRVPAEVPGWRVRLVEPGRDPDVWRSVLVQPRRRNPDHLHWFAVEPDGAVHERGVGAIAARPEPVADDGHSRGFRRVLIGAYARPRDSPTPSVAK